MRRGLCARLRGWGGGRRFEGWVCEGLGWLCEWICCWDGFTRMGWSNLVLIDFSISCGLIRQSQRSISMFMGSVSMSPSPNASLSVKSAQIQP